MSDPAEQLPDPAAPSVSPTETLADGIMILLALTIVQRGVGFVRAILFCRWLEPEQLGQWDMASSFLMMAAPLSVLTLSSSFRRYVEHFRQQGRLRPFLKRTTTLYAALGCSSVAIVYLARYPMARVIFGTADEADLVGWLAIALAAVIAHHYFLDLFGALRSARLLAILQMAQSLLFALVGVGLLSLWRCDPVSVVIAFGVASTLCAAGGIVVLRGRWQSFGGASDQGDRQLALWSKVLPFVGWISLSSLMGSLFEVADRTMIVHFSSPVPSVALAQVGLYHSCRIVPLLLVSVVAMTGSIITPHLAHDWEAGRRDRVAAQIQLLLKLFAFGLTVAAVLVMLAAPLLFGVALQGKFDGVMTILPWTLTYCIWFALFALMQNYVWCCERAYLAMLSLFTGLVLNVCLNLILLPRLGLLGAVLATAVANLVALTTLLCICRRFGLRLDRPCWIAVALPVSVCLGPLPALLVLGAVAWEAARGSFLLSSDEKERFADYLGQYTDRATRWLGNRRVDTPPAQT